MIVASLENVSYDYHGHAAIKDVSLEIKRGEVVYLIGENGAGKSTLLLILAALYPPAKGTAKIFGVEVTEKTSKNLELRRKIGIVFQDPDVQLFSPTVYDDVAFAPKHLGKNVQYDKMTMQAMKRMKIWHLRDRHPYELSEGEKKRASISTILSYDPEFMLFDEPTANMDVKGRRDFKELIGELKKREKTVVIATHILGDIHEATRVIVMSAGRKIYDGTPEILDNSAELKRLGII